MNLQPILLSAVLAATALPAAAGEGLTLATGLDYSRGSYGSSVLTEITYIPFSAKYETGPWLFKLTVPWLRITGPGGVVGGGDDRTVLRTGSTARFSASGQGDVVAGIGRTLVENAASGLIVDVAGKVKFGTADADKGLGTGKNDYALQTDVSQGFGSLSAIGTLGYKVMGDPPGLNLRNVWFGSVGAAWKLAPTTSAGVMLDLRQASVSGGRRQREVTFYAAYKLGATARLQGYLVRGLADGSPDLGIGASLSAQF
ncbi:MAG: hypothetical protein HZC23_16110 [Rhodocyclales bacterium]|nr:hypothetical protein [Rhodocyclales bacterium]